MSEPTVQVPVSLIEGMPHDYSCRSHQGALCDCYRAEFAALLSQPTPTAEPDEWCREEKCQYRHWRSGSMPTHKRGSGCPAPPAKPPRIEDMAPGTTFVEEVRWTVTGTLSTGMTVAHSAAGDMRFADRFDPSTIRDVAPPPTTPENAS